jgi:hypothetical protein
MTGTKRYLIVRLFISRRAFVASIAGVAAGRAHRKNSSSVVRMIRGSPVLICSRKLAT